LGLFASPNLSRSLPSCMVSFCQVLHPIFFPKRWEAQGNDPNGYDHSFFRCKEIIARQSSFPPPLLNPRTSCPAKSPITSNAALDSFFTPVIRMDRRTFFFLFSLLISRPRFSCVVLPARPSMEHSATLLVAIFLSLFPFSFFRRFSALGRLLSATAPARPRDDGAPPSVFCLGRPFRKQARRVSPFLLPFFWLSALALHHQ